MADQLPVRVDLTAYRGDSWGQTFRLKNGTTPVDLTGATVTAWAITIRGVIVPLAAALTNPAAGELRISVGPGGLPQGGHQYDVEVLQASVVTTWIHGALNVAADITHSVTVGAK